MKFHNLFVLFFAAFIVTACQSKQKDESISADVAYNKGLVLFKEAKYKKAAESFSTIYFQHPGNHLSTSAEIMEAYSLYLATEYEEAIDVLDIFIKLHPVHQDIAYVYYLKALSYYMQMSNPDHDQSKTYLAKASFEELISKFPNTKYAVDASLKLDLVNDHIAGSEMNIGRFYLAKNNPIAAAGRFTIVANNFQTTSHIEEALYRMVECYKMLGLKQEAEKYASVLGYNYPNSIWYQRSIALIK